MLNRIDRHQETGDPAARTPFPLKFVEIKPAHPHAVPDSLVGNPPDTRRGVDEPKPELRERRTNLTLCPSV